MLRFSLLSAAAIAPLASFGLASRDHTRYLRPSKPAATVDSTSICGQRWGGLYIPRTGPNARNAVYNLDTLEPQGEIPKASARGAAVDPKSHHGFSSSKPVVMWDSKTLATIKTIAVEGNPDGILFDPFNQRVWVFSHSQPNATIINSKDGSVAGTLDLGGAPEQAVTDGKGHIYVDLEDKDQIAAVDAAALKVMAHYELAGKGGGPGGLAFDVKNHILFATCHDPATMVILKSDDGKILDALPIGNGTDAPRSTPAPWKRSVRTAMARSRSSRRTTRPASRSSRISKPCRARKR